MSSIYIKMNWTRKQHILAFNLYCRLPFGKMHKANPEIIELGKLIDRSPGSVAMKLGNFARLDPALKSRGISGLSHGAKGESDVWDEFANNAESLAYESEKLRAQCMGKTLEDVAEIETNDLPKVGKTREAVVKVRVNQSFFRRRVLSAYNHQCCITGLAMPELLVAGHIIPWSVDKPNRLNPQNGLCLNMLHDKAFDRGLIWIDDDFCIHYTDAFMEKQRVNSEAYLWMQSYEGKKLLLPKDFSPSAELLKLHSQATWR